MQFDGTLTIDDNLKESRLDGTLLATQGAADPLGDATATIESLGFGNNQAVRVTGTNGQIGPAGQSRAVIFMTGIAKRAVAMMEAVSRVAAVKKAAAKKIAVKKLAVKTSAIKKAPDREPPAKKAPPRKVAAKKTALKKAAVKKVVAEKSAAKKAAMKKTAPHPRATGPKRGRR